jgi:electron transfer flavoprotein beta subunit
VTVDGDKVTIRRDGDTASDTIEGTLPLVLSVSDQSGEPRYPSFKGIMAAKKKPVETLTVADLDVDTAELGLANAGSTVLEATPKPPRTAGEKITDEGDGGTKIAEYLVAQKII